MRYLFLYVILLVLQTFSKTHAQIDVQRYKIRLQLSDASDTIKGVAEIQIKFLMPVKEFRLQLAHTQPATGKGMRIDTVSGNSVLHFAHLMDYIHIELKKESAKDEIQTFSIAYAGIPADGLIISKNKWNERTFFSDNWPDRAHQWLPCNDRPDDKAAVEFLVTAPDQYKVISNGTLLEEKSLDGNRKAAHWNEETQIPTKVMAIGVARFAVKEFADSSITPVSAWVYPQDSAKGFYDYALAPEILKFFSDYIGPYPFEKLANVQSKTSFGGMENASCIFYAEKTVTGDRKTEALMAHEIAHQWFGNSATEQNFAHVWLSEGFATYMTHVYLEKKYGRDTLLKRLEEDRNAIIRFSKQWPNPVVDSLSDFTDLLNANSYEKGGWVLHMLRREVGDSIFQNIIRTYYNQYKFGNADTWAFEKVAEAVSGKELTPFFDQWIRQPGLPKLRFERRREGNTTRLKIIQVGKEYHLPLTLFLIGNGGRVVKHNMQLTNRETEFKLLGFNTTVFPDRDVQLLFEEVK